MSKTVAKSIRRGLEQAVAYARGETDRSRYRVHVPQRLDVRAIRTKLGRGEEAVEAGAVGRGEIVAERHASSRPRGGDSLMLRDAPKRRSSA